MTISLDGRLALRELMEQAWRQVEGQAREMMKRAGGGAVVGRAGPAREPGPAAGRESLPLGLHGAKVLDDAVGEHGAGARSAAAFCGKVTRLGCWSAISGTVWIRCCSR